MIHATTSCPTFKSKFNQFLLLKQAQISPPHHTHTSCISSILKIFNNNNYLYNYNNININTHSAPQLLHIPQQKTEYIRVENQLSHFFSFMNRKKNSNQLNLFRSSIKFAFFCIYFEVSLDFYSDGISNCPNSYQKMYFY